MTTGTEGNDASYVRDGRLASYVYLKTNNPAFMKVGVNALLASGRGRRNEAIRSRTILVQACQHLWLVVNDDGCPRVHIC
jgi:hypothetical protein